LIKPVARKKYHGPTGGVGKGDAGFRKTGVKGGKRGQGDLEREGYTLQVGGERGGGKKGDQTLGREREERKGFIEMRELVENMKEGSKGMIAPESGRNLKV